MKSVVDKILNVILPWRWWQAYWRYIDKISTSGYMQPPSWTLIKIVRVGMTFWRWVQVGKMTVINGERLERPGPVVICGGTHSSMLDGQVTIPLMNRFCRMIGAQELFRYGFGLGGIVLSNLGVIPVDRAHGGSVLEPAINCVVAGDAVGLFAEGKISPTGELLKYQHGVGVIALEAWQRLGGQRVRITPVHICFGKRDPASAYEYLKMGFKWRYGVTVTVLEDIWIDELDPFQRDPEIITCLVRAAVMKVECATASYPDKPCGG